MTPHGFCYLWNGGLVWLHTLSDIAIGVSYLAILATIFIIRIRETEQAFNKVVVLFAAFICLCGLTHFFSVWNIWNNNYWLEGLLKAATAVVSLTAALVMIRIGKTFNKAIRLTRLMRKDAAIISDLTVVTGNIAALNTYFVEILGLVSLYQLGVDTDILIKYMLRIDLEFVEVDFFGLVDATNKSLKRLNSKLN